MLITRQGLDDVADVPERLLTLASTAVFLLSGF